MLVLPQEPSWSIFSSWANNIWSTLVSRQAKSDKIFQNHSTLKVQLLPGNDKHIHSVLQNWRHLSIKSREKFENTVWLLPIPQTMKTSIWLTYRMSDENVKLTTWSYQTKLQNSSYDFLSNANLVPEIKQQHCRYFQLPWEVSQTIRLKNATSLICSWNHSVAQNAELQSTDGGHSISRYSYSRNQPFGNKSTLYQYLYSQGLPSNNSIFQAIRLCVLCLLGSAIPYEAGSYLQCKEGPKIISHSLALAQTKCWGTCGCVHAVLQVKWQQHWC